MSRQKRVAICIVFNGHNHLRNQFGLTGLEVGRPMGGFIFDQVIFVEGASKSTFCTSWCKSMPEKYHSNGHSVDFTLQHLKQAESVYPDKVKVITTEGLWDGKVSMFNEAVKLIKEPCWLWQVDVDEYWKNSQLDSAETILTNLGADVGAFSCDYMLSDDVILRGNWGESDKQGYTRLWNYQPGRKFLAHEPPVIEGSQRMVPPMLMPRFKHLAYYYEQDVKFKSEWYGDHEHVYENWKAIKQGKISLPCSIDRLFGKPVQKAWQDTIITYA